MTAETAGTGWFALPPAAEAVGTPESRGLDRDGVRMLVVGPDRVEHLRVRDLPEILRPGDLVVVNTSATLPAAVPLTGGRAGQTLHVSTELDDGSWVVEVRRVGDTGPAEVAPDAVLHLPGGVRLRLARPHPAGQRRLWRAVPMPWRGTVDYLREHGHPIRYAYLDGPIRLGDLQTVYATQPGSAEMPSAGRPLTDRVLVRLMARGVTVAPLVLHTGVSSAERHEPPQPERFTVPEVTARLANGARRAGRRVVAVGTTAVRALESATAVDGRVHAAAGWTDLVLSAARPARVVTGLLTGLHDPMASHLDLLEAVSGTRLVRDGYAEVTRGDPAYLWHELGDTMLLLP